MYYFRLLSNDQAIISDTSTKKNCTSIYTKTIQQQNTLSTASIFLAYLRNRVLQAMITIAAFSSNSFEYTYQY